MNKEEIKEKIYDEIEKTLCVDRSDINDESNLSKDLGADSLDAVEIIMNCEKVFNIACPDDEAEKVNTIGDLIALIEKKVK